MTFSMRRSHGRPHLADDGAQLSFRHALRGFARGDESFYPSEIASQAFLGDLEPSIDGTTLELELGIERPSEVIQRAAWRGAFGKLGRHAELVPHGPQQIELATRGLLIDVSSEIIYGQFANGE